jgi:hypothetical protein
MKEAKLNKVVHLSDPTAGGNATIAHGEPYTVALTVEGVADIIFHRWNCEAIEEKAKAAKNSKGKKTDDVETYVYRNENGHLCIPGTYMWGAIINAAKFRQDPRSPRKSAMDLFKAGVVCTTPLASLGVKTWDYLDKRRVTVQRQGINRVRPALRAGWKVSFDLLIVLPEYIDHISLRETIDNAGRFCGLGDHRPTYGRFVVAAFK